MKRFNKLDLHITLDPDMRLKHAGEILLLVKQKLHQHFPELDDILIQIEPHHPIHYQDVTWLYFLGQFLP